MRRYINTAILLTLLGLGMALLLQASCNPKPQPQVPGYKENPY